MRDHQGQGGTEANNTPDQAHLRAAQLPSFRACLELSAMSEEGFVGALTQTSLSRLDAWCLSDLERLLAAALRYGLSPTGRELFLVPDPSGAAPLLVVGVDGWSRILNAHEQFAGLSSQSHRNSRTGCPRGSSAPSTAGTGASRPRYASTCARSAGQAARGSPTRGACSGTRRWCSAHASRLGWATSSTQTRQSVSHSLGTIV